MRLLLKNFWIIVFFSPILSFEIQGQVSAIGAGKSVISPYSNAVYFHFYAQTAGPSNGQFVATSPQSGNASFEWFKFDASDSSYNSIDKTDSVVSSSKTFSEPTGYKVQVTNSRGLDTTFVFWFFKNNISFTLVKDLQNYVLWGDIYCSFVDLRFKLPFTYDDEFYYYIPDSVKWFTIKNSLTDSVIVTPNAEFSKSIINNAAIRISNPPFEESEFICIMKDKYGAEMRDTIKYKPKRVKAALKSNVDTLRFTGLPDYAIIGQNYNYAPVVAEFTNETKNGNKYVWYMGDGDTIETETLEEKVTHNYFLSEGAEDKEYTVWLVATNNYNCIDSARETVKVSAPDMKIPNVFTPTGQYPEFRIQSMSVAYYKITIYSKWGKIVCEEEGNEIYKFRWNGNINNTGPPASPGVYFYTLIYRTYDKNPKKIYDQGDKVKRGFIYLFR